MALFIYLFMFLVLGITSWYHTKYIRRNKLLAKIPAIKSYPLIGSNLSFVGKPAIEMFKIFRKASDELGPLYRFDLTPFHSTIVVSDPKIIEGILSSQKLLDKSVEYNFVKQWLNEGEIMAHVFQNFFVNINSFAGLLTSTGKKWHQRRKIITPTFHFKILEHFTEIMEKQGQVFISNLKKREGQHCDFFSPIGLYALDVICGE